MKLNLLLLMSTLPIAIYAQDDVTAVSEKEYPNTFSSNSADVQKFDTKAKKFNDWSISVGGGTALMTHADLTSVYDNKVNLGWNAYVSLDKQISHSFGLSLQYQMGKTEQQGQLPGKEGIVAGVANATTKYQQVSILGDINFSNLLRRVDNKSPYRWSLHGYAGIGFQGYQTELLDNDTSRWSEVPKRVPIMIDQKLGIASFFYQGGLGLKYKISRRIDIEGRVMYIMSGDEEFDGGGDYREPANPRIQYNTINDTYSDNMLTVNLGLSFKLGKHISHLAWHDPLQETYARLNQVANSRPELVVCETGDNDNDGVCDDWDRQLDTPSGARVDGAGVALDLDLDGVIDLNDKCVTVPGPVSNQGCPEVSNTLVESGDAMETTMELEGIEFDLDSHRITSESTPILNNAVKYINSSKGSYRVIGATDTRASDAYNQKLSESRANTVKNYLIQNGVKSNKLQAIGRGEKDLKYPECNPASKCPEWKNRANRRVYFEAK